MFSGDDGVPVGARRLARRLGGSVEPRFSICVMLTNWTEYREAMASFCEHGFDESCCEYLVVDNSGGNAADGYVALNEFLQAASARHIIICHQDVVLVHHGRSELEGELARLEEVDPFWGVCGNAGYTAEGWPAVCISHPHKAHDVQGAPFPAKVVSLDENFLVVRREANLALSRDLQGFHHYGADLCTMADVLGWTSYVIGFFLRHKSGGTLDDSYDRSRMAITAKYARALRPRWVHVITREPFFISGLPYHPKFAVWHLKVRKALGLSPRGRHVDDPSRQAKQAAKRSGVR